MAGAQDHGVRFSGGKVEAGLSADEEQAFDPCLKAAKLGCSSAQTAVATRFVDGEGTQPLLDFIR